MNDIFIAVMLTILIYTLIMILFFEAVKYSTEKEKKKQFKAGQKDAYLNVYDILHELEQDEFQFSAVYAEIDKLI